jgi:hypothetical protein
MKNNAHGFGNVLLMTYTWTNLIEFIISSIDYKNDKGNINNK